MRNNRSIYALALLAAFVMATNAFASRARLLVLGTGETGFLSNNGDSGISAYGNTGSNGSMYVNDMYNVFYNPAYISDYKDTVVVEKSNGNGAGQGGFITGIGGINLGLYFNRVDSLDVVANKTKMRPIDIMIGGEHVVKWGLGFTYASYKSRSVVRTDATNWKLNETTDSDMSLFAGFSFKNLDPFFSIKVADEGNVQTLTAANNNNQGLNGLAAAGRSFQDWKAGVKYTYGEWVPYAGYRSKKVGVMNADKAVGTWGAGFGRSMKGSDSIDVNYGLSYWRVQQARTVLPIDLSVEGKATSWLTLRGGLRHAIIDRLQQVDNTLASQATGATTGRLGAGFNFGRLDLDWAIGSTAGAEAIDGVTFDSSNGLFTAASLAYRW